jgi:surface polysaccharide O-acyltransferase-like enzyme
MSASQLVDKMTGKLTTNLTTYDLFKAAAVILMIVDHIGYYFYPEENWFRVAGRMCVPIWFFLIGYAQSRDLSWPIWAGLGVLVLGNMVAGMSVFPLNVLGTMIAVRFLIDPLMGVMKRNAETFMCVSIVLLMLAIPTYSYTEYGTQGMALAIFGYLLRHRPEIRGFKSAAALILGYALFCVATFTALQMLVFGFDQAEMMVLLHGIAAVYGLLYFFKPKELPGLSARLPGVVKGAVQFFGRHTLAIYVGHLLLFKAVGVMTDPDRFLLWNWTLLWVEG